MSHLTLRLISETTCRNKNNEGAVQPKKPRWEWLIDGHEFVWSKHFSNLLMGWTVCRRHQTFVCGWNITCTLWSCRRVKFIQVPLRMVILKDLSSSVMLDSYTLPTLAKPISLKVRLRDNQFSIGFSLCFFTATMVAVERQVKLCSCSPIFLELPLFTGEQPRQCWQFRGSSRRQKSIGVGGDSLSLRNIF